MKVVNIGLFGFGVVGEGIYKVISERPKLGVKVKKIVVKHENKNRNGPSNLFSIQSKDILGDDNIDLVIELINDDKAAFSIVKRAIKRGKSVISANKKMIAENHIELINLSRKHGVSFLYEAAVCGSVPIIRNLEEYFDNDLLTSVKGIVNGSTNYILSKMTNDSSSFGDVLVDAQEKGFAEKDPTLDIEGFDAANKLSIITTHAFGKRITSDKILRKGINSIHLEDIRYAKEKGLIIKLIAKTNTNKNGELNGLSVFPTFINPIESLGQTSNEFNGVLVSSRLADEQFFYGKGAGRYPTSSAVLSDVSAYTYGYRYGYKKGIEQFTPENCGECRFYISHDKNTDLDSSLFNELEEKHEGKNRNYWIGILDYHNLINSGILENESYSLISFN